MIWAVCLFLLLLFTEPVVWLWDSWTESVSLRARRTVKTDCTSCLLKVGYIPLSEARLHSLIGRLVTSLCLRLCYIPSWGLVTSICLRLCYIPSYEGWLHPFEALLHSVLGGLVTSLCLRLCYMPSWGLVTSLSLRACSTITGTCPESGDILCVLWLFLCLLVHCLLPCSRMPAGVYRKPDQPEHWCRHQTPAGQLPPHRQTPQCQTSGKSAAIKHPSVRCQVINCLQTSQCQTGKSAAIKHPNVRHQVINCLQTSQCQTSGKSATIKHPHVWHLVYSNTSVLDISYNQQPSKTSVRPQL